MMMVMAAFTQRILESEDGVPPGRKTDLQQHLQSMFVLLPQHHVLKEVVRLESVHKARIRYLAVIACTGTQPDEEEACVLGFDCLEEKTTLGLVLCLYADAGLTLDGDGGFILYSGGHQHVFKPVSVHVLWAVIQSLHKACDRAQQYNHYPGGGTHRWVESYRITSDRSCLNEWHYLPDVESRRPDSPQDQKADRERQIRSTLKEVMMALDLDVVTSKDIRGRVEEELQMDLTDQKSFLDQEMLTILGQMDGASRIFDDLFLGSEWNASNLEELERNGIGHILNVTREIDNFFPDQFDYLNIRVYDDEATELLKHWDRTYKFIRHAQENGSKVLVHCKMGVSRSASVVVAYAMKARHWDLPQALKHVKEQRACVKPNTSFMHQLEIYAGILDASRQRHNHLWRSKSETNLTVKLPVRRPEPPVPELPADCVDGADERPKSWSPDDSLAETFFPSQPEESQDSARAVCVSLRVPCSNGRTYSVSQNRAVQLESSPPPCIKFEIIGESSSDPVSLPRVGSVKDRIYELEAAKKDIFSAKVDRVFEREERRQSDGSVPYYSSDPSLPTEEESAAARGLVRMQCEALEKQRRSLPDEPVFTRSISETTEGSVMRLRRELEAKAAFPLTGSFAPPPLMIAAFAAAAESQSTRTSPTRPRPVPDKLRKRSLSLERISYPISTVQDWKEAPEAAAEEVDLNVKLLVGRFEMPQRPAKMERPRGWSESSLNSSSQPRPATQPRRSLAAKPPVPEAFLPISRPATVKKHYGKTHPLDRLSATARQQQKLAQPVFGTM